MKHFFNHYYLFTELRRKANVLTLISKYGYYEPLENAKISPDKLEKIRISDVTLFKQGSGKIRLLNPFFNEVFALGQIANCNDDILIVANYNKKTVELFICDYTKDGNAFIVDLTTKEELLAEVNLMRQRAFSMS